MPRIRKFSYLYVLQGCYSLGWEDLCAAEDTVSGRKEIRANFNDYVRNERGTYRTVRRRVPVASEVLS